MHIQNSQVTHSCIHYVHSPSIQVHTVCSWDRWRQAGKHTDHFWDHMAGQELLRHCSHTDDSRCMSQTQMSHPTKQKRLEMRLKVIAAIWTYRGSCEGNQGAHTSYRTGWQTHTLQRSQCAPVTPGLQRQCPVWGSHDLVPHGEQLHSVTKTNIGSSITKLTYMVICQRALTQLNLSKCLIQWALSNLLSFSFRYLLTGAVFGSDGIAIVTWCTDVTMRSSCLVHAAQTLSSQRVTICEQHVGVCVAVAMARLTTAAKHHWVAIETRGTPM